MTNQRLSIIITNNMNKDLLKMKKLILIILLAIFLVQGFGQNTSAAGKTSSKRAKISDTSDIRKVVVGKDLIIIQDDREAVKVKVGKRGITILESLEKGEPRIRINQYPTPVSILSFEDEKDYKAKRRRRFTGHWAGAEFGFNNYLTEDITTTLPEDIDYMSLHSGKSYNFNANIAQTSLGLTRRIGFVTGLGINWNNYRFDGNNNIYKEENGIIAEYDPALLLKKSKFSTLFLTLPVLLEFQIPADHNHLNIAAGPIGAVKLYSYSKMVFDNGDKVRSEDDFSLNMLRYGATLRMGYENFQIYGTTYFTPLFKTGKAPGGFDLYPFEIGFAFTID